MILGENKADILSVLWMSKSLKLHEDLNWSHQEDLKSPRATSNRCEKPHFHPNIKKRTLGCYFTLDTTAVW